MSLSILKICNMKLIINVGLQIIIWFNSIELLAQKVVRYDLYVRDTLVNFGEKERRAIAVNGQIPMPTLTFVEGDTMVKKNWLSNNKAIKNPYYGNKMLNCGKVTEIISQK